MMRYIDEQLRQNDEFTATRFKVALLRKWLDLKMCDQYRWAHQGTRSFHFGKLEIKRKTSAIDANDGGKQRGDNRFKRLEYWGIRSSYLIHYIGDHEIYKLFSHRNCKKSCKPFVRSAPHVKEKVISKDPLMSNQKVYQQLVNESDGGTRHIVCTPRDPSQVKNFRKELKRQIRTNIT